MLSFAGVDLLQPGPEVLERLERGTVLSELWQFPPLPPGPAAGQLQAPPPWPDWFEARLNVLYWPQGAARFSWGRFLADEARLLAIRDQVFGAGGDRKKYWVMADGRGSVATYLYFLESRPLEQSHDRDAASTLPGAHLVTLVDERYFWWLASADVAVLPGTTTWADLYAQIGAALGVTVTADDVDPIYGLPPANFAARQGPLPCLLDAVALAAGQRVARGTDSTVRALSLASSRDELERNLSGATARLSGGRLSVDSPRDADAMLPAAVRVVFGASDQGMAADSPFTYDVALNTLAGYERLAGVEGRVKQIFRPEVAAGAGVPANYDDLAAVASLAAADWVGHQLGPLDECFEGALPWRMEGLTALVEYEHSYSHVRTRCRRGPWDQGVERHGPGAGQELRGGGVVVEHGTVVNYVGGGTVSFADETTLVVQGGSYLYDESGAVVVGEGGSRTVVLVLSELLLEDGGYAVLEDGTSVLLGGKAPAVLEDATVFVTRSSDFVVAKDHALTFRGGNLVFCLPWWLCTTTLPSVTADKTALQLDLSTSRNDVPIDAAGVKIRGIVNPTTATTPADGPRLEFTITNSGTQTGFITHRDPLADSTTYRIETPGGRDYPFPPGTSVRIWWDPAAQIWILPDQPGFVVIGVPGGQQATAGTQPGDTFTIASTTDATKGGITVSPGDWLAVPEITPPATPASGYGRIFVDSSDSHLKFISDAGTTYDLTSATVGTAYPKWSKVATKTYADLSAAGGSNDVEVYSLAAKEVIHGCVIRHSAAFTGGAIATYTVSVGYSSSPAEFAAALNVFAAPTSTGFSANPTSYGRLPKPLDFSSATSVRAYANCSGAFLSAATAGSLDVWLLLATLP